MELLIKKITVSRENNKTDFKIESNLKSVCVEMVAGEIFMNYTDEHFPFLFGRRGTIDQEGAYLSMVCGDTEIEEQSV